MAIFKTEKELNDFMEQGITGLLSRFGLEDSELLVETERGIDFCRTLMAEYSRLLKDGKIKRPLTYSADYSTHREEDGSIKLLSDLLYGRKESKREQA